MLDGCVFDCMLLIHNSNNGINEPKQLVTKVSYEPNIDTWGVITRLVKQLLHAQVVIG